MLRFHADPELIIAEAGDEARPARIAGIAVPWAPVSARVSDGTVVSFERGAFDPAQRAAKLVENHDLTQLRGTVTISDGDEGLEFEATFADTAASRDAVALVKAGAYDSVSVGANPTKWRYEGDTMVVEAATLVELSLVAVPAFAGAVITEIAATAEVADETPAENPEEEKMSENPTPEVVEAAAPAVVPTAPIWATAKKLRLPSPGEYIAAMRAGGSEFAQLNANIQAATGDVVVSDAGGVVPTPIVSPIYDSINPLRPIVSALGPKAMPQAGASFIRPYVKVRSAVGNQANELAALSTADFEVDDVVVNKKTFGGKLILSEQVIDWSSPSMLDAAINDMAGQYALATEKEVVDVMAAAVTNSQEVVLTSTTDEEEFIRDLYLAASSIAEAGNYLPNALVVSPKMWATLGGLTDSTGRAVFPQASPISNIGTLPGGVTAWNGNPLGLSLVVSNQITDQAVGDQDADDYYWLLNTRGVEVYEQYKGFLRDESVGTLGVTIAVRGYFAAKVIDVNMIRVLGPNAAFA
jgi:HK97 family phage prohead protease/HK97 family phage major capsid protein